MIDFANGNTSFTKLKPIADDAFDATIGQILVDGETVVCAYKAVRDGVIFTSKRIIAVNVQGLTGTKKAFTSLPYSKVQAFAVETAGVIDNDSELDLWFSGLGKVRFEFTHRARVAEICRTVGSHVLGGPLSTGSVSESTAPRTGPASDPADHHPPPQPASTPMSATVPAAPSTPPPPPPPPYVEPLRPTRS